MELGLQTHHKDSLLRLNSMMTVYMDPLGYNEAIALNHHAQTAEVEASAPSSSWFRGLIKGALVISIGFGGILKTNYNKEPLR